MLPKFGGQKGILLKFMFLEEDKIVSEFSPISMHRIRVPVLGLSRTKGTWYMRDSIAQLAQSMSADKQLFAGH